MKGVDYAPKHLWYKAGNLWFRILGPTLQIQVGSFFESVIFDVRISR